MCSFLKIKCSLLARLAGVKRVERWGDEGRVDALIVFIYTISALDFAF